MGRRGQAAGGLRRLSGVDLSRRRRFRYRTVGSAGQRQAGHRLWQGRLAGNCDPARRLRWRAGRTAGPTGIFFTEQTPGGLIAAVELFERTRNSFDPVKIRRHAAGFSRDRFKAEVKGFIEAQLREWRR